VERATTKRVLVIHRNPKAEEIGHLGRSALRRDIVTENGGRRRRLGTPGVDQHRTGTGFGRAVP
jgi:hypothetical protein